MEKISKEKEEIIWGRVNKLKEKYPMNKKKVVKMVSAKKLLGDFEKDNLISIEKIEEDIASLVVAGSLQFGCYQKSKEKIVSWINEVIDMTQKKTINHFNKCWRNLEKNGVFKKGKIYANFDGECDGLEFSLLIGIAQGLLERTTKGVA